MPWRGPEYEGEFPSLGWDVIDWAAKHLQVPDGPLAGEQLVFTDEQVKFIVRFYALNAAGVFVYRRAALRRPQGWGKSPLLGALALGEVAGPTRFVGWDARGEPVAVAPTTPWVQVAAVSEDQTDNTYAAAYAMVQDSDLAGTVIDVGLTRMFLIGGHGRLEPVTASAGSRLGQRLTFVVPDETHLWLRRNGGKKLMAVLRRNVGKMNGRSVESTNAHEPGEGSVAEDTWKAAQAHTPGLLYDSTEAPPVADLHDRERVLAALRIGYGDSGQFVDLERIAAEIADPGTDPTDARRFYFNQLVAGARCPVDIPQWELLGHPAIVADGTRIGVGFDGSLSNDMTCLYGCTETGYLFRIESWARPENAPDGWKIPRAEVEAAVHETFDRYDVGRMWCDPPRWQTEIEGWAQEHGEELVMFFDTQQPSKFALACDRFATATREASLTHDAGAELTEHLAGSARKTVRVHVDEDDGRTRFVIVKADVRKIDAAVAGILAYDAAMTMPEAPKPKRGPKVW